MRSRQCQLTCEITSKAILVVDRARRATIVPSCSVTLLGLWAADGGAAGMQSNGNSSRAGMAGIPTGADTDAR